MYDCYMNKEFYFSKKSIRKVTVKLHIIIRSPDILAGLVLDAQAPYLSSDSH